MLHYRLYRPGDERPVRGLFERVFGKPMSPEHWRWKYRRGPLGEGLVMVGVDGVGEVVAHYGVQPLPFQIRGRSCKAGQLTDGMIRADYRGCGRFLELCRRLLPLCDEKGFELLFVFPAARMFRVMQLAGFFLADRVHRFAKKLTLPNRSFLSSLSSLGRRFSRVELLEAGEPSVASLWRDFRSRCSCSLERTREYLRWRYDLHPSREYLKCGVFPSGGGEPASFWAVREDEDAAWLLEGFGRDSDLKRWGKDLEAVERFLAGRGASELRVALPLEHPLAELLSRRGYEATLEAALAARLAPGATPEPLDGWYYSYGDHDDF